jgi:hypothetical protein
LVASPTAATSRCPIRAVAVVNGTENFAGRE